MNVFNLTETQQVSEMLKEGVDYKVVKDGNGAELKIVNLENPKYCSRKGIIEIEAMKRSNKHENTKMFRCIRDKQTGLIWGIPTSINPDTKELQFKAFWIEDRMTFDLSIPSQAMAWAVIKNSPFIEGSPNQHGKSVYKVIDKERQAAMDIEKRSIKRQAEDIIESLKGSALEEMAVNLGVNVEANRSVFMLTSEVFRKMEENPKAFIDLYKDPNREYVSVFNRALSKGIIKHDIVGGNYIYGNIPLGHNKEMAVKFLVDNTGTAAAISSKCDVLESDTKKSMQVNIQESDNKELEYLQKIAELEAKLLAKASENKEENVEFKPAFKDFKEEELTDNYELESLRDRARELKIKGFALPHMTVDKLKDKISEVESQS